MRAIFFTRTNGFKKNRKEKKCQITNLSDAANFQKLIGNKCQSSIIFLRAFSSVGPSSTNGGRVREFLFSFPLIFKVVISIIILI